MSDGAPTTVRGDAASDARGGDPQDPDPKVSFVRRTEWIAPFYCYISAGPHESQLIAMAPIDNERCFTSMSTDPNKPLNVRHLRQLVSSH